MNAHVRSDQGIGDAAGNALQPRALEDDRVLDLAPLDEAVRTDRRVGPNEGVPDFRPTPDDRGAANDGVRQFRPRLDHHLALTRQPESTPSSPRGENVSRMMRFASSMSSIFPV